MPEDKLIRTKVSRRTMVAAAAAAPVVAATGALASPAADDLVSRCASFLAVDLKIEHLVSQWGALETAGSEKHPTWWELGDEGRLSLPEGKEMARIDETLSGLFRQREQLLKGIPELATTDPSGLVGKIAVASRVIRPEDEPLIHGLLTDAARDLAHMNCPDCNRPLTPDDVRRFMETLS